VAGRFYTPPRSSGRHRNTGSGRDFYRTPGLGFYGRRAAAAADRAARAKLAKERNIETGGPSGGFGSFLGNLGGDAIDIVTGVPSAFQLGARSAWFPVALALEQAGGVSSGHRRAIQRDLRQAADAIKEDYATRWGPLFTGDFDEFGRQVHEHPGLFALDVGAAWSGAGALVAGGARLGARAGLAGRASRLGERTPLPEGVHRFGDREVYSTGDRYRAPRRYEMRLGENTDLGADGPAIAVVEEARRAYSRNPLTRGVHRRVVEPIGRNFSEFLEARGNAGSALARPFSTQARFNRAAGRQGRDMRYEAELARVRRLREGSAEFLDALREAEREYRGHAAPAIYLHLRDLIDVPGETPSAARKAVADFMERGLQRAVTEHGVKSKGASRTIRSIEDVPEGLLTLEGNPALERVVTAARDLSETATSMRVEAGTIAPETAATVGARAAEMVHGGSVYDPKFVRPTDRVVAARAAYQGAVAARRAGPRLSPLAAIRKAFAGGRQAGRGDRNLELAPRDRPDAAPQEGLPRALDEVIRPDEVPANRRAGAMRGQRVMPDDDAPTPNGGAPFVAPDEALRARVGQLTREADALDKRHAKRLREMGKALRDHRETMKGGPRHVGKIKLRGTQAGNEAYRGAIRDQDAANRAGYVRNVRDEERYRAEGGKKSIDDHAADYLEMVTRARERGMEIPAEDAAMLDDLERVADLRVEADRLRRELDVFEGESWLYDTADRVRAEAAGRAVAEAHGMRRQQDVGPKRTVARLGTPEQMALYGRGARGPVTPSQRVVVNAPIGPRTQRPGVAAARARAYGQILRGEGKGYSTRVQLRESQRLAQRVKDARKELRAAEREARGGFTPPNRYDVGRAGAYFPDRPADRLATARNDPRTNNAFGRLTQDKVHESHGTLFGMGNVSLDPRHVLQALDRALVDDMHPGFIRLMVDRFAFRRNGEVAEGDRALMAMEADPQNVVLVSRKRLEDSMRLAREAPEGQMPDDPFRGLENEMLVGEPGLAAAKQIPAAMRGDVIAIPKAAIDAVRQGYGPGRQFGIYDTPLQLWRRGILAFAPRWYLNNLFGNTLQFGLLTGFDVKALSQARMGQLGGLVPERVGGSTIIAETRTADTLNVGPARAAYEAVTNRGMDFNHRIESWIRRAAFISRSKRGLRQVGINPSKLSADEWGRLLEDFPTELMDEVMRDTELFMGNYVRMSPFERAWMKRIFPFYSWMRVIGRFMGGVPIRHPKRVALAAAVSRASAEAVNPEDFMLPLYDRGRVNLPGGLAWRTFSANPFTTHAELVANIASGNPINVAGGLARDVTPIGGQQVVQYVSGRNPFGRPFSAPPGYDGRAQAFGFPAQQINPATGLPEESQVAPPWYEMALQTVPIVPGLVRGLASGGRPAYDVATTFDLVTRRRPDWQLFREQTNEPANEQLMAGPVPINPFLSILGLNTVRRNREAERARYARIVERFRDAQAQTARRVERASR
jgi:hypothetical protein